MPAPTLLLACHAHFTPHVRNLPLALKSFSEEAEHEYAKETLSVKFNGREKNLT